jgi:multidrug resistance efflux pump
VERLTRYLGRFNRRNLRLAVVGIVLFYAIAMLWPNIAALLVRNSAVTAWTNIATAPIQGRAPDKVPFAGSHVGDDGVIFQVTNDRLDPGPVKVAEAALVDAQARTVAAKAYLEGALEIDKDRRELLHVYADNFRAELDAEIVSLQARVELFKIKAENAAAIAQRTRAVTEGGYRSKDYRDEGQIKQAEAEAALGDERRALERARTRRAAADKGVYVAPDGTSPNWAYGDRQDAKIEIKRARLQVEQSQSDEQRARQALASARDTFRLLSKAPVLAPPGSTIRSVLVGEGATMAVGEPLAKWIDCKDLFLDAPISDAALPLIPIGSKAEAIIEGRGRWYEATVTNVRGSAETIGSDDLAAVAKGRSAGIGQVILRLEAKRSDFIECPVGEAAYVHFPTAGVLDVLLARFGL